MQRRDIGVWFFFSFAKGMSKLKPVFIVWSVCLCHTLQVSRKWSFGVCKKAKLTRVLFCWYFLNELEQSEIQTDFCLVLRPLRYFLAPSTECMFYSQRCRLYIFVLSFGCCIVFVLIGEMSLLPFVAEVFRKPLEKFSRKYIFFSRENYILFGQWNRHTREKEIQVLS